MELTIRDALREAIDEEMQQDDRVFLIGEEVGKYDGAYKVSRGLLEKYGPKRIIDTPICEESFTGFGIGSAMLGLRPIVEWMSYSFSLMAYDQIINNAAKLRYMSGGQISLPIVFRGPNGHPGSVGSQHSQSLESIYTHCPGLYIVSPSNPHDAKNLLKASIRNDNPVIFLESETIYSIKGEVKDEIIELGKGKIVREGSDLTIISYSKSMYDVLNANKILENDINIEIIDLRSLRPLDKELIFKSVKKTSRCLIVSESWPVSSFASYLAFIIQQNCFDYLDAPIEIITSEDVPMPYSYKLELFVKPSADKIIKKIKEMMKGNY